MRKETFDALALAYLEMMREHGMWRIENQALYCSIRDAIAKERNAYPEVVQDIMEACAARLDRRAG